MGGWSVATLTVPRRYNGPASSGNGGWTAGALAAASGLPEPVTVRLRRPPPLDTPLRLDRVETAGGTAVELRDGDEVVAVALPEGPQEWAGWEPVGVEEARSLEASYAGFRGHPFPRCFSCGTDRPDGLRIFPGRLDGTRVAASWTPDASVAAEGAVGVPVTWAALDCVSAWSTELEERPIVLGQMCARVPSPPRAGTPYAVVGATRRIEGRKTWTASAMFDPAGRLVAQAEHVWVAIDRETVAALQG
jgi:hypothetical protein